MPGLRQLLTAGHRPDCGQQRQLRHCSDAGGGSPPMMLMVKSPAVPHLLPRPFNPQLTPKSVLKSLLQRQGFALVQKQPLALVGLGDAEW